MPCRTLLRASLRRAGRPTFLVVNKAEGMNRAMVSAEFHQLGLGDPLCISSAHGDNVTSLMELILESFPEDPEDDEASSSGPRVAIVGRPNVGKSTLFNRLTKSRDALAGERIARHTGDHPERQKFGQPQRRGKLCLDPVFTNCCPGRT